MSAELRPGIVARVAPGLRRIVAPNPGLMTGPGTNSWLLGETQVAVIDPGPDIASHVDAIVRAADGAIRWILVTHTHPDHSPAAARLAAATGAEQLGRAAPAGRHQDATFRPDRTLLDGERLETAEFGLEVLHTPGHASNHLCYRHRQSGHLFTGDHIINGSTVIIDPPDGDMKQYLCSLERLRELAGHSFDRIAPGHGDLIRNPRDAIDSLIAHRLGRESKLLAALQRPGAASLGELVAKVYTDVDPSLHTLAERSLLAHLIKLEGEGRVSTHDSRWLLLA